MHGDQALRELSQGKEDFGGNGVEVLIGVFGSTIGGNLC